VSNSSPKRKEIIDLLQLLASEEQQLAYERDVPHVDVTNELVCMWFDDHYHPGPPLDPFFSLDELAAIHEFSCFFEDRLSRLPESLGTVRTWLGSPVWREVMEQARKTLERFAT
jgi:hypothetical protein